MSVGLSLTAQSLSARADAVNMLAGALAGISEHAVMFPVDSVKVRDGSICELR